MAESSILTIIVDAQNKADAAFKQVESSLSGLKQKGEELKPAFQQMAIAGGIAFGGIIAAVKVSTDAARAYNMEVRQLEAVLKSTGGVAGVTKDQVVNLAEAFQKETNYSNDAVLGAENLLLTFTHINKDIFPEATSIVLDMSQALGQDLKSSAIQVGKALQDPVLGVTALRRVGVNFSKDQIDVIKSLVDTGQAAKAQALIMKELQTEFGGSAKAAADPWIQLQNTINDLQKEIGQTLLPVLQQVLDAIRPIIEKMMEWVKAHPELTKQIIIMAAAITGLIAAAGAIGLVLLALNPVALAIAGIIAVLVLLGKIIYDVATNWKYIWLQMKIDFGFFVAGIKAQFQPLIDIFNNIINLVGKVKSTVTGVASTISSDYGYFKAGLLGSKAEGGYIPQTGPYLMHAGEYVVKADRSNMGSSIVFNFNGDVNDKDSLIRMITDALNRQAILKTVSGK